ncbi:unnamed protein product [Caenorhabditis nigoni]
MSLFLCRLSFLVPCFWRVANDSLGMGGAYSRSKLRLREATPHGRPCVHKGYITDIQLFRQFRSQLIFQNFHRNLI